MSGFALALRLALSKATRGSVVNTQDPPVIDQDIGDEVSIGVSSDSATFAATTSNGNALIAAFSIKGVTEVDTITDNAGNVWSRLVRETDTDCAVEIWGAFGITGDAAHEITVTYSASTNATWSALELSNVKAISAVDPASIATATGGGGSSDPATVTGGTPSHSRNLWIAALSLSGGGSNAGIVTPEGWTEFNLYNDYSAVAAGEADSKRVSTSDAETASWANETTTSNYAAAILAVRNTTAAEQVIEGEAELTRIMEGDAEGIFYNPQDLTSMYVARTPSLQADWHPTVEGDPIRLRLDKARMGGRTAESYIQTRPNLITNGTFDADSDWSKTNTTISGGAAHFVGTSGSILTQTIADESSLTGTRNWVVLEFTVSNYSAGTLSVNVTTSTSTYTVPQGNGTFRIWDLSTAAASDTFRAHFTSSDFVGDIDSVIYRYVPGSHAYNMTGIPRLHYNVDTRRYGVQNMSDTVWHMLADMTAGGIGDYDWLVSRELLDDKQGIFLADNTGSHYADVWADGDAGGASSTYDAVYVNNTAIASWTRDKVADAYTLGSTTPDITHLEGVASGFAPTVMHFGGSAWSAGVWENNTIDYGIIWRPNNADALKTQERRTLRKVLSEQTQTARSTTNSAGTYAVLYSDGVYRTPPVVADFAGVKNSGTQYYELDGTEVAFGDIFTWSGSANDAKPTVDFDGLWKWAPHNCVADSGVPTTENLTVYVGAQYTVEMTGTGSVALSGAGSGTVTAGNPVTITASTTTLTLTPSGSPTTMWAYRSDLGGMQLNWETNSTYVATSGGRKAMPRLRHHYWDSTAQAWVNGGLFINSTAPDNRLTLSNSLDNFSDTGTTRTNDAAIGPDGQTSAHAITPDTGNTAHRITFSQFGTANHWSVFNAWFKADGYRYVRIRWREQVSNAWFALTFDLETGTRTDVDLGSNTSYYPYAAGGIREWGNSGWYQLFSRHFQDIGIATTEWHIEVQNTGTPTVTSTANGDCASWTGDGTSRILIWQPTISRTVSNPASDVWCPIPTTNVTRGQAAEYLTIPSGTHPITTAGLGVHMHGQAHTSEAQTVQNMHYFTIGNYPTNTNRMIAYVDASSNDTIYSFMQAATFWLRPNGTKTGATEWSASRTERYFSHTAWMGQRSETGASPYTYACTDGRMLGTYTVNGAYDVPSLASEDFEIGSQSAGTGTGTMGMMHLKQLYLTGNAEGDWKLGATKALNLQYED